MTYREVSRTEKNRGQRKQLLYEDGEFSSRGRLGFYISKRDIVLGGGPITPLRDKWSACYSLLQSTILHTAKYYSSSAPVLQSTTPVRSANIALVRTTKYSSVLGRPTPYYAVAKSTAPYYKVLLQYILQSTTPVLLCTSQISPNAAPATKIDPPTSPNNALATRSDTPT